MFRIMKSTVYTLQKKRVFFKNFLINKMFSKLKNHQMSPKECDSSDKGARSTEIRYRSLLYCNLKVAKGFAK